MGIIIRQSIKSTIVSYIGIVIGIFNTLWLLPKFFLPEEVGLIRLMQDIPLLLAVFLQLGAANLAEKFFPYFMDEESKDRGFFMLLILYPLIGFLAFVTLFFSFNDFWKGLFIEKSALLTDYFLYIVPLAFFMMYLSVLDAYARVNFRIVVPAIIRDVIIRILLSVIGGLYALKIISFNELIVLFTFSYGFSLIIFIGYIKNLKKLFLKIHFKSLNSRLLKEMGKYVLFIIPGTAGSLIASKIDTLMLGGMAGLNFVGVYSLAYFIGTVVEIPRRALSQISIPFISQAWKANDLGKIEELYKKTALNQLIVGSFILLIIWCNVDEIIALIPRSELYKEGKYVILLIGLSRLFDMATGINGEIILYSRYYKFNLISIMFLSVLTVVSNVIFIPLYGINGAAFGFVLSIFLHNVLKSSFIWVKFKIQPFNRFTIVIVLLTVFIFLLSYFIPCKNTDDLSSFICILIRSFIITALFFTSIHVLKISPDLNNFISSIKSKTLNFLNKK